MVNQNKKSYFAGWEEYTVLETSWFDIFIA